MAATAIGGGERVGEILGVLAAVLSSALGGASIGATRYLAAVIDPLAIGVLRFGVGFLMLVPIAMLIGERWPARRDWPGLAGLGLLFFFVFPILFNAALIHTTAARGALALSTLPLLTLLIGAALGSEPPTARKLTGVLIAMGGVTLALVTDLEAAPAGAWQGDLLMIAAACCMALYNVWSKPFIGRSGPFVVTVVAMGVGAACLVLLAALNGSLAPLPTLGAGAWVAGFYLGAFGSALTFFLWAVALGRTSPTKVAIAITVNPIAAALVGAVLLDEPIGPSLVVGIVAVFIGIWTATTERRRPAPAT